jgi:hypothetical protein
MGFSHAWLTEGPLSGPNSRQAQREWPARTTRIMRRFSTPVKRPRETSRGRVRTHSRGFGGLQRCPEPSGVDWAAVEPFRYQPGRDNASNYEVEVPV